MSETISPSANASVSAPVNIGRAAQLSGVSAKMIRHYEQLGLLPTMARSEGGYRLYHEKDIHSLRFIRRSRDLGFSMAEIAELLGLWRDQHRTSAQVRQIAARHADDLAQRISTLQAMQQTLQQLVHCCHGNDRPDCPILDELSAPPAPSTAEPRLQH